MSEECLICQAPLKYLEQEELMECVFCHKKEYSHTQCIHGHYVCDECHIKGIDQMINICSQDTSSNPIKILTKLMALKTCHMHGPEHHIMVGSALLTAYRNAGGDIDLEAALMEMQKRGRKVPGGACGFWGACGAAVSSGMFLSIITKSTPLSHQEWGLSNLMTAHSLQKIGEIGGPRCCKRNSFLSVLAAIEFVKENLGITMESQNIVCHFSSLNNQCIKKRCPFYNKK